MNSTENNTNVEFEIEEDSWAFVDEVELQSASETVSASDLPLSESESVVSYYDPCMVQMQERINFLEEELAKERRMREGMENQRALVFKLRRELEEANKAMLVLEQKTVMNDVVLIKRADLRKKNQMTKRKQPRVKNLRKAIFHKRRVREKRNGKTSKRRNKW